MSKHPERLGMIPEDQMSSFELQEWIANGAVIVFVFAVIVAAFWFYL
jgi:hypothetical protein